MICPKHTDPHILLLALLPFHKHQPQSPQAHRKCILRVVEKRATVFAWGKRDVKAGDEQANDGAELHQCKLFAHTAVGTCILISMS